MMARRARLGRSLGVPGPSGRSLVAAMESATSNYYQRLGVKASASSEEIRAAYRALAGRLHPDRMIDASSAERTLADRRMREVNEAWQELRDPVRRRRYDEGRLSAGRSPRSSTSASASSTRPSRRADVPAMAENDDLVDVMGSMGPVKAGLFRHGPWVALAGVFLVIFVVTAYASSSSPAEKPVGSQVGTCVNVAAGPTTTVVPCDGPHELRIVERIPDGGSCPAGTEKRRLAVDGYLECVRVESSGG